MGFIYKKYSFDLVGNTIVGVFGSIFFIKSVGKLGFDPSAQPFNFFRTNKLFMINIFKIISFLEGVSYILLLFIGVPMKYFADNPIVVKSLGMPHGLLFLAYLVMALLIRGKMNWDGKTTMIVLVASILPFGTFYINKKYLNSVQTN